MKTIQLPVTLTLSCLLAACATFSDQARQDEPHAVIRFTKPPAASPVSRTVKLLDGASPRLDRDYRITPGTHELVIEVTESSAEIQRPFLIGSGSPYPGNNIGTVQLSQDGQMSASGINPMAPMQPVNLQMDSRQTSTTTRQINVDAGWRYEHDGTFLRKTARLP